MAHFLVEWIVDEEEADCPAQAAQLVASRYFQQRIADGIAGTACVFAVTDDKGYLTVVDLSEE